MKLREHVSGLLSHFKGSNDVQKQRKHHRLRSLLLEQLEGRRLLAVVDLATIGAQGTILYGADIGDASGISVSSAGDVNGDGYDDMIIGALQADASGNAKSNAGESYVVFGAATLPATINLDTMGLSVGFKIFGSDIDDFSGSSVSGVGDVNGDGLDDLVVGASFGDALGNAKSYAGEATLIFGAPSFAANIDLSASLGSAGMKIYGADTFDQAGFSVSNAGDVNGDGFNDLAIGANFAAAAGNAKSQAGESYVIFGSGTLPSSIDLSALGSAGITIHGADVDDQSGYSIGSAGDVNGDGFDDLIIGAVGGDASGNAKTFAGDSYIVFGGISLPSTIDLAVLGTPTGSAGVTIFGSEANDESGFSVSSAGDVNGDGFDDVIVGARYADAAANGKVNAGESYVIYGAASLLPAIDLATLGAAGIIIYGLDAGDQSGFSVSGAGDVNADGYDDLIIGALKANTNLNTRATGGESYVVLGGPALASTIDLATLAAAGITIYGFGAGDESGTSVSAAGDVNGDGFDDVIIGAFAADAASNAKAGAGESYVVFGTDVNSTVTHQGTSGNNTLNGDANANMMVGGRGNDTLNGNGGADVLIGGQGNDTLVVSSLAFRRVVGGSGSDTLSLNGTGLALDLETLADNRILGIETIDITGTGNNSLSLNRRDVLRLSDSTNILTVRGNTGDSVSTIGWMQGANEVIGPDTFKVYTQGNATLKVQLDVDVKYTLDLALLASQHGTTIYGAENNDASGWSVSNVGDVNGDGFEDLLIGAPFASASGNAKLYAGDSYIVFGAASLPATIDLATLGSAGVTIFGTDAGDYSGFSVSGAGDVNGDGFDDLVIGSYYANGSGNAESDAGDSYIIFGGNSLPTQIDLSTLSTAGVTIFGSDAGDRSGFAVSGAGDVNGDGFDDVMIGAYRADSTGARIYAGDSYVIFGTTSLPTTIDLSTLGSSGMTIYGEEAGDESGRSLSSAGDVNGDGYDDLLIGARRADASANGKNRAGDSYVVFGSASPPTSIDLATLSTAGVKIYGAGVDDESGISVSSAGDVNGDGFDDLIVGAHLADAAADGKSAAGDSYLIYGSASLPTSIDLATSASVTFYGADINDKSGFAVSGAGDVNGDGYDDLLIGAFNADAATNGKADAGETYLIFGGPSLSSTIDLALLGTAGGPVGLNIFGAEAGDFSGNSVSSAGDINGDGYQDLVISSRQGDAATNAKPAAGEAVIIYGRNFTDAVTHHGTAAAETMAGTAAADKIVGGRGNDTIAGNGGSDVILGGQGNDVILVTSTSFGRVDGGTGSDTLQLVGSGLTLDLTTISNAKLFDIETIDLTGSGNNTLTLDLDEVLNLSSTSNQLIVRRNAGDVVNRGAGWTQGSNQTIGPDTFAAYTQGAATLLIQMASPIVTITSGNKVYDKLVYVATASVTGADAPSPTLSFTYYSDAGGVTTISAPTNVGTYYVRAFTAANATNLAAQSGISQFVISQKLLTATFTNGGANKTYNSSTAASVANANITLVGVVAGDTVTATASGTFDTKNVGTGKSVVIDLVVLAGASNLNYNITTGGTLTSNITARTLTVNGTAPAGVTGINKVYNGNNAATVNVSLSGVQAPDVITATANGTFNNKNAGTGKPVTVAANSTITLSGTEVSNYTIGTTGGAVRTTTANITVAAISDITGISADNKVYDATTAATLVTGSASFTGKFAGDTLTVATSSGAFVDKDAANGKTVNITGLTLGGGDAGNYTLASSTASTTANITALAIAGSITAANKPFDGNTSATILTRNLSGVLGGDTVSYVNGTATFDNAAVGNGKTVTATGLNLSGLHSGNYTVNTTAITTANIQDVTPPTITGIFAAGTPVGSTWSPAFIDAIDGGGTGAGNGLGYALTSLLTLSNTGINRIYIQFSEPVAGFNATNFRLFGSNTANYASISTVSYDSLNNRGVIALSSPITKDKLRIGVSDAVTDASPSQNALDGDGNASAGGVLNFRFNILVGDASNDGSVNGGDLSFFSSSFNKSAGNAGYNPRADWNSDGSVNGGDLSLFSGNFNQSLPSAEPPPLDFMPPPTPESLYAPEIDDFFSQFDEEDELQLFKVSELS